MQPLLKYKTVNGIRYVHDEIAYHYGSPYWIKDQTPEEAARIREWAKNNPPTPKHAV